MLSRGYLSLLLGLASGSDVCSNDEAGQCTTGTLHPAFNLKPIHRREASTLSYKEFIEEYHSKDIPLIITNYTDDWALRQWNLERLSEKCGDYRLFIFERIPQALEGLRGEIRENVDNELQRTFNISLEGVLKEMKKTRPLSEFITLFLSAVEHTPSFQHIAHYAWPMEIHDKAVLTACFPMYKDLIYPKYIPRHPPEKNNVWDKFLHPRMFVAPGNSRAYPAHRHGQDEHSMLLMLQGRKHYVNWGWDMAEYLYPFSLGSGTETGDVPFMANPFTNDTTLQPLLTQAEGWEGIAEEGDLLYIPRGIHIVHNLEPILAVGYVHQLNEKVIDWSYSDVQENQDDVFAHRFLRDLACMKGETINSIPEDERETFRKDLDWILRNLRMVNRHESHITFHVPFQIAHRIAVGEVSNFSGMLNRS